MSNSLFSITAYRSPTGKLVISTNPTGATIYLDGVSKGTSPVTISSLQPGDYLVKATLSGYYDRVTTAVVTTATTTLPVMILDKKPTDANGNELDDTPYGGLDVASDPAGATIMVKEPGASVFVEKGMTPALIEDEPGDYEVYLTKADYKDSEHQIVRINLWTADRQPTYAKFVLEPLDNLPPSVGDIIIPADPVVKGTPVSVSALVTCLGQPSPVTAEWLWGDGSASPPQPVDLSEGAADVLGSHSYATPGFYRVSLRITSGGNSFSKDTESSIIVYDPQSGFVTGLGSIKSPAGAYAANPALTGPATFELLARYPIGRPFTGVTLFQFPKAKIAFSAVSYDWLVIRKDVKKAFYKGSGKINGKGDYGFLIAVIDGSKPSQDKIRVKLWDKVTGVVIYDTQPGAADTADPTTQVTSGMLVITKL
jgi:PKD repeat protein